MCRQTQRSGPRFPRNGPGSRPPLPGRESKIPAGTSRHRRTPPSGQPRPPCRCVNHSWRGPDPRSVLTLKRTFHDTANRFHENGIGYRWPRRWVVRLCTHLGYPDLPAPHRPPSDINLELAQRISSSLHGDSARAIFAACPLGCHERRAPPLSPFIGTIRLVAGLGRPRL